MDKTVFPDVPQEFDTKHFARQMKQMTDDLKDVFGDTLIRCNNIEMGGV